MTPSSSHTLLRRRAFPSVIFAAICIWATIVPHALHAQTFDATTLREPVDIGIVGVTQAGDNPAWSSNAFDDSKWLPVDATTRLSRYFTGSHTSIVWRRLHVTVNPQQADLALQTYVLSRAFEVYVNGQKLFESGQVQPYVAYTRYARLIVPIPPEMLRTGSLTIAIRARAPLTWWSNISPAFNGPMLTIGSEATLRNRNTLAMIAENGLSFLEILLSLGVGLVALALFLGQRQRTEYFWIFVQGIANAASLPLLRLSLLHNLPGRLWSINQLLRFITLLSILLMVQAFLRKPFGWLLWTLGGVALLVGTAADVLYLYGLAPAVYAPFFSVPFAIYTGLVLPILLVRQMRRGNREAGILLIPVLLLSMYLYVNATLAMLASVPGIRHAVERVWESFNVIRLGPLISNVGDLGAICFYCSLAIIITLRSTRMSREQALLESEMAAAAEIQQIIVPEQAENIPGFAIESVYQPANQVGGDFFQILPSPNGGLFLVVGDVAGKGLPAAMLVSVLVGAIRTAAVYSQSPSEVLSQLNHRLVGRTHGGFSTALAAHIAPNGQVTIANAGHLSPYLDGHEIDLPGAVPLGIESDIAYESTQFLLPRGSRLTFYSDGVVEAQNPQGELFGFDRAKAISTQPAATIAEAAKQFGQSDDITVVTIEHLTLLAHPAAIPTSPILVLA